jgi:hypothetical protein
MNILAALSAEMAGGTTIEIGGKNLQKSGLETESESKRIFTCLEIYVSKNALYVWLSRDTTKNIIAS